MARTPIRPRTVLVVGNGLTLSFLEHAGRAMAAWDTGSPLGWDIVIDTGQPLDHCFPVFYRQVGELRTRHPDLSDFAIIDEIVRAHKRRLEDFESALLYTEVRHFLSLAYSHFQGIADNIDLTGWVWDLFLAQHADEIGLVVSFNYDLIVERLLANSNIRLLHFTIDADTPDGVPIGKPHGSIDYTLQDNVIVMGEISYPPKNALSLIDAPIRRINSAELLSARLHVELVPPMQATAIRHFQWVAPLFEFLRQYGGGFDRCIFAGLSCWPVDQPELREIMASMSPNAEIIVSNPDPRATILFDYHARDLGLRSVQSWRDGPPA